MLGELYMFEGLEKEEQQINEAITKVVGEHYTVEKKRPLMKYNGMDGWFERYLISVSSDEKVVDKMYVIVFDYDYNVVASQRLMNEKTTNEWVGAERN